MIQCARSAGKDSTTHREVYMRWSTTADCLVDFHRRAVASVLKRREVIRIGLNQRAIPAAAPLQQECVGTADAVIRSDSAEMGHRRYAFDSGHRVDGRHGLRGGSREGRILNKGASAV